MFGSITLFVGFLGVDVFDWDIVVARNLLYGLCEAHAFLLHHKGNAITTATATKTMIKILTMTDGEGSGFLTVKRT